ncbi:MAG TPA: aminotransferase class I/II-fold pyridoxal phosphate-dependent enzyme, partial [Bacteroidetes bacterium]|nr:aminotransferase class I/II-fold pyridoxal phosphate-dependent enzyme [Bacteroidota bacterium]
MARPSVSQAEIDAVTRVLQSGWLSAGPKTVEFEEKLAERLGVPHVVAVNSCTSALHLTLVALGIGPGDEVITTPITFVSTVNAILYVGATPVLADVDPVSMNIRPGEIARRISPRTRAVIPVHMAGQPCDLEEIDEVADKHGIPVVEDAAHALGASYQGRP